MCIFKVSIPTGHLDGDETTSLDVVQYEFCDCREYFLLTGERKVPLVSADLMPYADVNNLMGTALLVLRDNADGKPELIGLC